MTSNDKWKEELGRLRSIIEKTGLTETTKWGGPVFTHRGKNILSMAGFKNHFVLVFFQGVFLKDPYQALQSAVEGGAKAMRHWRFTSADQINEKQILEYINEAIRNSEEGKEYKPQRSAPEPVAMPPLLGEALQQDEALKTAFEALAPYQQRLYMEHVGGAKQESTRHARLEKIKPLILEGIGLHDKYKKK